MQQLFERRYRSAEQGLHVRIGPGAGESTVKDGDYFGMPSIEAARLCAKAPTDGVLASAAVRMLAGRSEGVEFESVGELELEGFQEPLQVLAGSPVGSGTNPCVYTGGGSSRSMRTTKHSGRSATRTPRLRSAGVRRRRPSPGRRGLPSIVQLGSGDGPGRCARSPAER
jgi:hypothetical protein